MNKPLSPIFKKLSKKYSTPEKVQAYLSSLKYNKKPTMRSALETWRHKEAHCMEGAFLAAAILEPLGYPPLVLSFESIDLLEHVVFIYKKNNRWGSIGCSRDLGLKGRKPIFKTIKALAFSYVEPYIDKTGRITAYQDAHLDNSNSNWRQNKKNVWKAENYLLNLPHKKLKTSASQYKKIKSRYLKKGPMPPKLSWIY